VKLIECGFGGGGKRGEANPEKRVNCFLGVGAPWLESNWNGVGAHLEMIGVIWHCVGYLLKGLEEIQN
jgi:hypothetical protein